MDLVGSWSLPTAVSVDETCILGVSQEGEKKSYPLLIKVSFKVAQVLAVHFGCSRCRWKIFSMRYIMSVVLLVCGCTNASLDFSEKFCFRAAFHRLLNMRCGSNVNVFFLTHFRPFFFSLILPSWKITVGGKIKKKHLWPFVRQGKVLWLSPIGLIKSGSEKSRQLKFPAGEAISFTNGDALSQR